MANVVTGSEIEHFPSFPRGQIIRIKDVRVKGVGMHTQMRALKAKTSVKSKYMKVIVS